MEKHSGFKLKEQRGKGEILKGVRNNERMDGGFFV